MKLVRLLLLLAAVQLTTGACKKLAPDDPSGGNKDMEQLKVAESFNWETNRTVEFNIISPLSGIVVITSPNGLEVYHQGFNNLLETTYKTTVTIPSYLKEVHVNGLPVAITGKVVNVDLSMPANMKSASGGQGGFDAPAEGLLAAWHFDENSGTTAGEELGQYPGNITDASWTPGIRGSGLQFNGTTGNVLIPATGFNPTSDKISFSVWFKVREVGSGGTFIFQNVKYLFKVDNQGRVSFALYTPTWTSIVVNWSDRLLDTDWHHAVATYDGATMKIYVDGVLKISGSKTGNLQSTTAQCIIGKQNSLYPFDGILDEVLMYGRALSATEVTQLYQSTPDPGTGANDLISEWKLNENSGQVAFDSKGSNNGTISNASWGTGISGTCLNFNGTSSNVKVLNATSLNPVNELTMMVWAKTLENKTCKIMQKGDWDGHGIGQGKWDGWNVTVRLNDNTSQLIHWGSGLPVVNEWYHLAMTYDGSTLKMYVNGQLKNSKAVTGTLKVNTRDFSIGSDNAAQKFFNGSIDEVKYFSRALTQTEVQANYSQQGSSPDSDGDGVPNTGDSYPTDPARAFNNLLPSTGYSTLAFEDLWPGKGDYDFNDLVVDYRFNAVTNGSNKVTEIKATFIIRAIGAGLSNGFGFQLPGSTIQQADLQVTGSKLLEGYITLQPNGLEANQQKATVIVYDNVNRIMQNTSGFGVNVDPGAPFITPDTTVVTVAFAPNKYTLDEIGLNQFNPFLIVNMERGKEIHLPDFPPTSLVNTSYFGTGHDASNPSAGKYYKTAGNLPWAMRVSSSFSYTIERKQITSAYLKFASWAESAGALYPDWYMNTDGYRNSANIYSHP